MASLNGLPNELLLHILHFLPTHNIFPFAGTAHRYHDLVLRTLHHRLLATTSLAGRTLILEAYHPAVRLTEPEIHCEYLRTPGLSPGDRSFKAQSAGPGERLRHVNNLFSIFRPHRGDANETSPPPRHPAGDVPGSRTYPSSQPGSQSSSSDRERGRLRVIRRIHLDPGELFTQLTAATMLVEPGRRSRWYVSLKVVSEGVIRLFRAWLAERAGREGRRPSRWPTEPEPETSCRLGKGKESIQWEKDQSGVVWVNDGQNVGVRFEVREVKPSRDNPILVRNDEEVAASYEILFEEVFVRTRHLLTVIEQSLVEHQGVSGNAIIVGPKV